MLILRAASRRGLDQAKELIARSPTQPDAR